MSLSKEKYVSALLQIRDIAVREMHEQPPPTESSELGFVEIAAIVDEALRLKETLRMATTRPPALPSPMLIKALNILQHGDTSEVTKPGGPEHPGSRSK